jgi:succinate--hydroxymethylglutarate CoA-transferase
VSEISKTMATQTTEYWLKVLEPIGIPFGPVNNIENTFKHPQVIHRNMIETVDHPTAGKIKLVGIPVKYGETKPSIRRPPPTLGQHTKEILLELGYSASQFEAMNDKGIFQ